MHYLYRYLSICRTLNGKDDIICITGDFFYKKFSKPLFTGKEKLNLKTYNSTLLDIYGISVGEKLKTHQKKRKYNNPRIYTGIILENKGMRAV